MLIKGNSEEQHQNFLNTLDCIHIPPDIFKTIHQQCPLPDEQIQSHQSGESQTEPLLIRINMDSNFNFFQTIPQISNNFKKVELSNNEIKIIAILNDSTPKKAYVFEDLKTYKKFCKEFSQPSITWCYTTDFSALMEAIHKSIESDCNLMFQFEY